MATDLTEIFEKAHNEKNSWSRDNVIRVLKILKDCIPESQVDWEEGDENWGRVIGYGEEVAFCNALVPVVVVHEKYSKCVQLTNLGCHLIVVDSFSDHVFRIEPTILEQIVGRQVSRNVSYDELSILDLWWATVT